MNPGETQSVRGELNYSSNCPISTDSTEELLGLIRLLAALAHLDCDAEPNETPIEDCKNGPCAHAVAVLKRCGVPLLPASKAHRGAVQAEPAPQPSSGMTHCDFCSMPERFTPADEKGLHQSKLTSHYFPCPYAHPAENVQAEPAPQVHPYAFAKRDIHNLICLLKAHEDNTGEKLEEDDRSILLDIESRWPPAVDEPVCGAEPAGKLTGHLTKQECWEAWSRNTVYGQTDWQAVADALNARGAGQGEAPTGAKPHE